MVGAVLCDVDEESTKTFSKQRNRTPPASMDVRPGQGSAFTSSKKSSISFLRTLAHQIGEDSPVENTNLKSLKTTLK